LLHSNPAERIQDNTRIIAIGVFCRVTVSTVNEAPVMACSAQIHLRI